MERGSAECVLNLGLALLLVDSLETSLLPPYVVVGGRVPPRVLSPVGSKDVFTW